MEEEDPYASIAAQCKISPSQQDLLRFFSLSTGNPSSSHEPTPPSPEDFPVQTTGITISSPPDSENSPLEDEDYLTPDEGLLPSSEEQRRVNGDGIVGSKIGDVVIAVDGGAVDLGKGFSENLINENPISEKTVLADCGGGDSEGFIEKKSSECVGFGGDVKMGEVSIRDSSLREGLGFTESKDKELGFVETDRVGLECAKSKIEHAGVSLSRIFGKLGNDLQLNGVDCIDGSIGRSVDKTVVSVVEANHGILESRGDGPSVTASKSPQKPQNLEPSNENPNEVRPSFGLNLEIGLNHSNGDGPFESASKSAQEPQNLEPSEANENPDDVRPSTDLDLDTGSNHSNGDLQVVLPEPHEPTYLENPRKKRYMGAEGAAGGTSEELRMDDGRLAGFDSDTETEASDGKGLRSVNSPNRDLEMDVSMVVDSDKDMETEASAGDGRPCVDPPNEIVVQDIVVAAPNRDLKMDDAVVTDNEKDMETEATAGNALPSVNPQKELVRNGKRKSDSNAMELGDSAYMDLSNPAAEASNEDPQVRRLPNWADGVHINPVEESRQSRNRVGHEKTSGSSSGSRQLGVSEDLDHGKRAGKVDGSGHSSERMRKSDGEGCGGGKGEEVNSLGCDRKKGETKSSSRVAKSVTSENQSTAQSPWVSNFLKLAEPRTTGNVGNSRNNQEEPEDILDVLVRAGLKLPRPRWWRPGGYGTKFK